MEIIGWQLTGWRIWSEREKLHGVSFNWVRSGEKPCWLMWSQVADVDSSGWKHLVGWSGLKWVTNTWRKQQQFLVQHCTLPASTSRAGSPPGKSLRTHKWQKCSDTNGGIIACIIKEFHLFLKWDQEYKLFRSLKMDFSTKGGLKTKLEGGRGHCGYSRY